MPGTGPTDRYASRHAEIERLLALALDLLDEKREQVVRDYLGHAITALERIRQTEHADEASSSHNKPAIAISTEPR